MTIDKKCEENTIKRDSYLITGLSSKEVYDRKKEGKANGNYSVKTKSVGQIIFTNIFSLFNIVNCFLALCIFLVHSYKNMMFMGVVFWNAFIGIFQEIRSKRIIDKLSLIASPIAHVLRNGKIEDININEIVLDDILIIKNGSQIPADAVVLEGKCEVNESLLTGESDAVFKKKGDEVLSGSFITQGEVKVKVIHVGKDNYVNTITSKAKYLKKPNSQINKSIKLIVKIVTICLIPVTALLFVNQYENLSHNIQATVVSTVAAVIGMIPSGLVLLTSVVLAVSVIRLSKKKTLVQEMYCIETLARVDVLCLDKTGTITEGTMDVEDISIVEKGITTGKIKKILKEYTAAFGDDNPTFNALREYANTQKLPVIEDYKYELTNKVPFSSDKKWGAISIKGEGSYCIGAMEYILENPSVKEQALIDEYSSKGLRVLTICHTSSEINSKELPKDMKLLAIIAITDKIRDEAYDTIKYFKKQGVDVKVISGDNPMTVSYIASKAGIRNGDKYIDTSKLSDEELIEASEKYTVFGRVRPDQKLTLVKALKANDHIVAMTGDGVNDVMALKEADCSIAMQSGSDAARNVSQIVLMDSNFASMPEIVAEGRRTINNLQRSAALYLTKTIYSTILAVVFVFWARVYPFVPIQLTLIGALSIGIPSFLLALEPNNNRVKGDFLLNVLRMAIPGGLIVFINIIIMQIFSKLVGASFLQTSTMCILGLAIAALVELYKICQPLNFMRRTMLIVLIGIFACAEIFFKSFFSFERLTFIQAGGVALLFVFTVIMFRILSVITETILGTTPNIYHVSFGVVNGEKLLIINDEVEKKDYFDITAMMKNKKVLGIDSVNFMDIKDNILYIDGEDDIEEKQIAANAIYYVKHIKRLKNGKASVAIVAGKDERKYEVAVDADENTAAFNSDGVAYKIKAHTIKAKKVTL